MNLFLIMLLCKCDLFGGVRHHRLRIGLFQGEILHFFVLLAMLQDPSANSCALNSFSCLTLAMLQRRDDLLQHHQASGVA